MQNEEDVVMSGPNLSDSNLLDVQPPKPSEQLFLRAHSYLLTVALGQFESFLNGLDESFDRAATCFHDALYSCKVLISHFDP